MKRVISIFVVFILLASAIGMFTTSAGSRDPIADLNTDQNIQTAQKIQEKNEIRKNLDSFGDHFTENQGQIDSSVKYYIIGKGMWFLDDGVVFDIKEQPKEPVVDSKFKDPYDVLNQVEDNELVNGVKFKLNFVNSNKITPVGVDPLPHKSNFFFGSDPDEWYTNIPSYCDIVYENIYDNIDLRYYLTSSGLKYDFIVHPGGSPGDIRLEYEGIEGLYVNKDNDLAIQTGIGEIRDSNLFIYQSENNAEFEVNGKFKLVDTNTFGFEMTENYDKDSDLVIDPALVYSTYLGGSGMDYGYAIEVDSSKNAYVTGYTASTNFNMTGGAYQTTKSGNNDLFVLKVNPTGASLVWATYLGGTNNDQSRDLAIDGSGNVYVAGFT